MNAPAEAYRIALAAWAETPTLEHVLDRLVYEGWLGPVPLQWSGWVRSDVLGSKSGMKVAEAAEVCIQNTGEYVAGKWVVGPPPWVRLALDGSDGG